ncbi:MAG: DNA polymerase III subunit delta [Christensenellaceae bacterium]|jgi:DNA polymerase-3 subunit delta|nr:DNA polymerase III subunit delta [Christensenellaceae bacterium]
MKFENLKQNLTAGLKPSYYITGEDSFLVYKALELVEKALSLSMPDFNKVIFSGEGFNAKDFVAACEVLPMGDNFRLVVVKDYQSKDLNGDKKLLSGYLSNPTPTTCLVFFESTAAFKSTGYGRDTAVGHNKFYVSLLDKTEVVECNRLPNAMLEKWIMGTLKQNDKTISKEALITLIEFCNGALGKIEGEINKLSAYAGERQEIVQSDVLILTAPDIEYEIFAITEALSKKDGETVYKAVDKLLENKESETRIISIITNHMRRLFYSAVSGYNDMELSRMLSVKEYAIKKAREQGKLFSKVALMNIYNLCLEVEYLIKSGGMQPTNALKYLIANILIK